MSENPSHPYYAGIETQLLADTGSPSVNELVQQRLYPDELPRDCELPAIRYVLLDDNAHQRLSSGDASTAELQIDVYTHRHDQKLAWTIVAAVKRALNRKNLTVTGSGNVHAMCTSPGKPMIEGRYYRIRSLYRLSISPGS